MPFIIRTGDTEVAVRLRGHHPEATVADLVRQAVARGLLPAAVPGVDPATPLLLDGEPVLPSALLADLTIPAGATLELAATPAATVEPEQPGGCAVELRVVGGLHAGRSRALPPGPHQLGRGALLPDPTVSATHARVDVPGQLATPPTITDHASTNGTWLGDDLVPDAHPVAPHEVIRLGASEVSLESAAGDDQATLTPPRGPGAGATSPFNRPPRARRPASVPLVRPPGAPVRAATPAAVGAAAVLVPVVFGAAMVVALHNLLWGLLALLGPVTLIGSAWEQRRRYRRMGRVSTSRFQRHLHDFEAQLQAAARHEVRRLRSDLPDPAEVCRRATFPSQRVWERRPGDADHLVLRAGTGTVWWSPPVEGDPCSWPDEVVAITQSASRLPHAPAAVDLSHGGVVGIAGPRPAVLAAARSLVLQAAVHHGPADLSLAVVTGEPTERDWRWACWLPHVAGGPGQLRVAPDDLRWARRAGTTLLAVVDQPGVFLERRSPVRALLGACDPPVAAVVLAERVEQLPSSCTATIELHHALGSATLRCRRSGLDVDDLLAAGIDAEVAEQAARALARLGDPECDPGSDAPRAARLLDLIDPDPTGADPRGQADTDLPVVLGEGADRTRVGLDLVADGPHLLVAGTTGSGKSELLRVLVSSLALRRPPSAVNFLLVDFKGGATFDRLGDLPHTVGVVSDLDAGLATRALRCLDAELRRRELILRAHRAADVADLPPAARPARLVVVIDEFATLVAMQPGLLASLVDVAQRGRSLGVHLVLATQRPSGAVSDTIRANVGARIALRVQSAAESTDVLDHPGAVEIPRRAPGRGLIRFGSEAPEPLQAAHVSRPRPAATSDRVDVLPLLAGPHGDDHAALPHEGRSTDLDDIVDTCRAAHAESGEPLPPPVWTPPLPHHVPLRDLPRGVGLLDDVDHQRTTCFEWDHRAGPLLLIGVAGSGTSTALQTIGLRLAAATSCPVHLYGIDGAGHRLAALRGLPLVGDIVGPGERGRQRRLVRRIAAEAERRRAEPERADGEPPLVLLVDDAAAFVRSWDDPLDDVLGPLGEAVTGGGPLGIHVALATERLAGIPLAWQAALTQRWVFRVADPADAGPSIGSGVADPDRPAGRASLQPSGLTGQVAAAGADLPKLATLLARDPGPGASRPEPVPDFPEAVPLSAVAAGARLAGWPWTLPVGIGEHDLTPAGWTLHPGDIVLVAGPRRSGRTTALTTLAAVHAAATPGSVAIVAGDHPGATTTAERMVAGVRAALDDGQRVLLLVDDADRLPDDGDGLDALLAERPPALVTVLAVSADAVRSRFGHVARRARAGGLGLLLQPDPDLDGDLVGVRLPRRAPVPLRPGRGWLTGGGALQVVQVAQID